MSKSFGPHLVLNEISAHFRAADVTFVVGRSGTGKSVLCKLAVGLEQPDAGEVELLDFVLANLSESERVNLRRKVPYLTQAPALLDWLTVEENIRLITKNEERVERAIETLDLSSIRKRKPTDLGAGAKKRASIARALAYDPVFVLWDEPTTGLDRTEATQVMRALTSVKRSGLGGVIVSHDYRAVAELADRVLWLREGSIAFAGSANDFFTSSDPEIRKLIDPPVVEARVYG